MQRNATQCNLQNSSSISMRPNTARHIRRRTRHKKGPLPQLATPPTQLLQIPHLPQRHTPQRQNLLMNISIFLLRRPALKRRRITHQRRKIRIVQPIQYRFFLRHASKLRALCTLHAGFGGELVVALDEARADHEDVAWFNEAALGLGTNVKALRFSTSVEFGEGNGVRRVRVVGDIVGVGIVAVVEEDGAAGDAVGGPVVNAALEVGIVAVDVGGFCLRTLALAL